MHPLRLLPLFKERPWGVRSLAPWLTTPHAAAPIGEAWFTSNDNPIDGGPTLGAAIAADGAGLLGREARGGLCPLLLKFLFTSERLSVQVHPDDDYARAHHDSLGKTEAWHVLDARPGATLGLGFTRVLARDEAVEAAKSGAIEHLLDWRPTAEGDTWLVPAHTVHAIGAGVTVLEVQENSDVTYRLYDYGRPRELHLERGFEVSDLGPYEVTNTRVPLGAGRDRLTTCDYFTMERWTVDGRLAFAPGAPYYHLVVVAGGRGRIAGRETTQGDVWLVPARSDAFEIALDGGVLLLAYTGERPTESFSRR
jgi:mannose-6-phosphate isomerase